MKLIGSYLIRHLPAFLAGILFLALEAFADLMQPAFMARIVDDGVKRGDTQMILHYGMMMLGIALLGAVGAVMRNLFASYTSQTIGMEMRSDMYRKIQSLSFENIDRLQPAALITRLTNDVTQVQDFVNSIMRVMIKAPMTCVGAVLMIVLQTPRQIPVMIAILFAVAGLLTANMKLGYPLFGKVQDRLDRLNTVSREFLSSVRVVKAFRAEMQEQQKFEAASEDLAGATASAMQVMAVFSPLIQLAVNLGIVALFLIFGIHSDGEIGSLMASVNYMTQILFAANMFSTILNRAVRAMASAERVEEIFREIPAQKSAEEQGEGVQMQESAEERGGAVSFRSVHFTYAGSSREALHDMNFEIRAGETIGIIGPTGSGKSTLADLIPRFYDADSGTVSIGGADVRTISGKCLRELVAVVPQKALLFTGSIAENLRWGDRDATDEEVIRAAKISCVHEFVQKLEQGYQTQLGQGGVNLSGGQKQRLSIARALLKKPEILILDDCTSALDASTEEKVLSQLKEEAQGMTVFLISQRIFTVMRADRILCMEQGSIQGLGTHEELMASCPTYRAIYHSQIGDGRNE